MKDLNLDILCLGKIIPRDLYCKECPIDGKQERHYCFIPINVEDKREFDRNMIKVIEEIENPARERGYANVK